MKILYSVLAVLMSVNIYLTQLSTQSYDRTRYKEVSVAAQEITTPLGERLDAYLKSKHFNGSVLVMKDGETILSKGYGYANFRREIPNTPDTRFRIGSVTKTVIAIAVLQLYEKGKIDIQKNVNEYVPAIPADKHITLYHMLTHTSGLGEEWEVDARDKEKLMLSIGKQNLAFQPGSKWKYSDRNYMVLSYIVEKISGESLSSYMEKNIFLPARMHDSGMNIFGLGKMDTRYSSMGYFDKGTKVEDATKPSSQWIYGCGEMYTTVKDMSRLNNAIANGTLLNAESLKIFLKPTDQKRYSCSLYVSKNYYGNHGIVTGWNAFNNINFNTNTQVIIFSNIQQSIDNVFNDTFRAMVIPDI